jgi:Protein of unknown function (DUF2950)
MRQSRYPASQSIWSRNSHSLWFLVILFLVVAGCNKTPKLVPAEGPHYYATPDAAGKSLYDAAKSGNSDAVLAIFGQGAQEYLLTGNSDDDRVAMAAFASDYEEMHRWSPLERGGMVLNVGVENYPFPFPLKKKASGEWYFDTAEAKVEFAARLVGDNELNVIQVLHEGVAAEAEYFSKLRNGETVKQYAQKIRSTEGKEDGLYWIPPPGQPESPLGPLAARAAQEGYEGTGENPQPFHGYFYRILTGQGSNAKGGAYSYLKDGKMTRGFAILAYPAEYRTSGVMTFIVSQDGQIFEKDLGPNTANDAKAMDKFDPDESWTVAE